MVLMNNFNKSFYTHQPDVWRTFETIFVFEIALLVVNIAHTAMVIWLNITAKQFHQNWTNIFTILAIQHIIATCAWLIQRIILLSDQYYNLFIIMKTLSYIRNICIFICLLSLPTFIIERYFATLFILDYEKRGRLYISYSLIFCSFLISCITSVMYHEYDLLFIIFLILLLLNGFGVLGNIAILHINLRYYKDFHYSKRVCSLAERFQISENIKTCKLVNMIIISMGGFNALICVTLLIDIFNISDASKNFYCLAFDLAAFLYSFMFPYICMKYSKKWQILYAELIHRIFGWQIWTRKIDPTNCGLHDTFGIVMSDATTDKYFADLRQSWK